MSDNDLQQQIVELLVRIPSQSWQGSYVRLQLQKLLANMDKLAVKRYSLSDDVFCWEMGDRKWPALTYREMLIDGSDHDLRKPYIRKYGTLCCPVAYLDSSYA